MSENLTGLTNGLKTDFATFVAILTTGTHADDDQPGPLGFPMPWRAFRSLTESDLEAIYTYVFSVPSRTGKNDKKTQAPARYCAADADCSVPGGETCSVATNECVGATCATLDDCAACQSCTNDKCAAPAMGDPCVATGL